MSNSIWKTREENPKSFSFILEHHKAYDFDNHKDVAGYDIFETGGNPQNPFDEDTIRWCYLDELLAQADKAERLEKENEAMRYEFEVWHGNYECEVEEKKRLQKAVDLALDALEYADKTLTGGTVGWETHAQKAIKEIKQLIKGTTNDE